MSVLIFAVVVIFTRVLTGFTQSCGGFLTGTSGWVASPDIDEDGFYGNNEQCLWIIETGIGKSVQIEFQYVDIEEELVCAYDFVTIDDGIIPKVHSCGTSLPPVFISESQMAVIEFKTDRSVKGGGFNATYAHVHDPTCGYRTWRNMARFGSFDTHITEGVCTWHIQGPRYYIKLHVYIFIEKLKESEDCSLEYLEVYNDKESFGRYCGSVHTPVITTAENVFHVDLLSDGDPGIKMLAFYTVTDLEEECGGLLINSTGSFHSLDRDRDGFYDYYHNCVWTMIAPVDHVIRFNITDFDVEADAACRADFMEIYDGEFEGDASLGRYCGNEIPPVIWSTSNVLVVRFFSNLYNMDPLRGFHAVYTHVHTPAPPGWYVVGKGCGGFAVGSHLGQNKGRMETFMMLLRNEDVVAFRNFTRLSPQMFLDLVEPLTPRPQGRHMVQRLAGGLTEGGHTTPAPRHEGQLQVFDVSFLCSSNPTTAEVWKKIAASYSSRWSFHHVIGALDGKPIHIRCPANGGSKFYNYKEYHSIVLHALVDANYRFTWVQVGALGEHLMPSCRMSRHCETQS